jgi:glycosyl transferase family 2
VRVAYLNPWANAAENQAYFSLAAAGRAVGVELVSCSTPEDAEQSRADFILSVASSVPKVVDIPSYLTVHEPAKRFLSREVYLNNLLSYDGYLTISDSLERFVKDVCFGVGRYAGVGFYYNSPQTSTQRTELTRIVDERRLQLVYIGTNWDRGRRAPALLRELDEHGILRIHGPERSWSDRDYRGYAGQLPWDGLAPQNAYAEAGMGLVLLSADHLREGVVSNRIFEITSVGSIAVCPRIPWIEKWFGDTVLYFTPSRSARSMAAEITARVAEVKRDPAAAADRAERARKIFEEHFAAERMLANAVAYHAEVQAARARKRPASSAEPHISVVVRCGGRPQKLLKRAVDSIRNQTFGTFTVILAKHKDIDVSAITADLSGRVETFVEVEVPGGSRAETLIAGLGKAEAEYFAILDDDDFWLSDHVETLFSAAATADPTFDVAYSGSVEVACTGTNIDDFSWHRNIFTFGLEQHPTRIVDVTRAFTSNCFVARTALMPPDLESLGGLGVGEDSLLVAFLVRNRRPVFSYKPTAFFRRGYDGESDYLTSRSRTGDLRSLTLRTSMLMSPVWLTDGSPTLLPRGSRAGRAVRHVAQVWREQGAEAAFRAAQPLGRIWLRERRAAATKLARLAVDDGAEHGRGGVNENPSARERIAASVRSVRRSR